MKRIGIVAALASEAACFIRPPPPDSPARLDDRFSVVLCGSGPQRARHGAELLLDAGVEALISFGVAGALSNAVQPGHLVVPLAVIASDRRYAASVTWRSRVLVELNNAPLRTHGGTLADSDRILAGAPEKAELRRATGAEAVDMESAAILEVAHRRGVPALVLRAVLDAADEDVPAAVVRRSDAYGRVRYMPLLADLMLRPAALPGFLGLIRSYQAATGTLRWLARNRERLFAHDHIL